MSSSPSGVCVRKEMDCRSFFSGSLTNLLQKAAVDLVDQADCRRSYGDALIPRMMCAGFMEGGRDACLVLKEALF